MTAAAVRTAAASTTTATTSITKASTKLTITPASDLSSFAIQGTTTRRFVGHTKDVLSVAFSADNRRAD